MAGFVKGDVVVIPVSVFRFIRFKTPALVLADLPGDDILLCQITSQSIKDSFAVSLTAIDFDSGSLPSHSFIKPTRIFTADKKIIIRKVGTVKESVRNEVVQKIN